MAFMVAQSMESTPPPLEDFSGFGQVSRTGSVYRVSEIANAGIYKTSALPAWAATLQFQLQVITPGVGDFVGAHPHVIQREEAHGGAVILHSLGNAVYPRNLSGAASGKVRALDIGPPLPDPSLGTR